MVDIPNVCLNLSNRPENVPVVHEALVGVAENLGLDALETNDLDTAVTEVCKNVVYHAYEGEEGPLEVEVYALSGAVDVVVRDHGLGIRPHVGERTQPHTGIGLPIVHALTQRVAFTKLTGGGTEVRMRFAATNVVAHEPLNAGGLKSHIAGKAALASTIEMALAPSGLASAVLPRVLSSLAERASLSAGRIYDVRLVAETLAANARDLVGSSHLGVAVSLAPRSLELHLGPLLADSANKRFDLTASGLRPAIERLTDDHRVASYDCAEVLTLRVVERT